MGIGAGQRAIPSCWTQTMPHPACLGKRIVSPRSPAIPIPTYPDRASFTGPQKAPPHRIVALQRLPVVAPAHHAIPRTLKIRPQRPRHVARLPAHLIMSIFKI